MFVGRRSVRWLRRVRSGRAAGVLSSTSGSRSTTRSNGTARSVVTSLGRSRPVNIISKNLDAGLIHEPAITDTVATRTYGVDHQRREALHPPIDRHVINVDAAFGEELFDVSISESVTEVPAHCQQDCVEREPESCKRRRSRVVRATTNHSGTRRPRPSHQRNSAHESTARRRNRGSDRSHIQISSTFRP